MQATPQQGHHLGHLCVSPLLASRPRPQVGGNLNLAQIMMVFIDIAKPPPQQEPDFFDLQVTPWAI